MIHSILVEQGTQATELTYHVWWPTSWGDPWYVADSSDIRQRAQLYNVSAIPRVDIDGADQPLNPTRVHDSILVRQAVPSHVWMNLRGWTNQNSDTIFLEVKAVADSAIGDEVRLYMAAAEVYTHWDTAAANGQQDFYGALLRMYPNGSGLIFSHSGSTLDTLIFLGQFAVPESTRVPWSFGNMRLMAWVQDTASRDVLQSASILFPALYAPVPGDTMYADFPVDFRWTEGAFDSLVTLQLMREYPSGEWETVITDHPNMGSATWTATGPGSEHVRFRIFSATDTTKCDTSDGDICIFELTTVQIQPIPIFGELSAGDTLVSWAVMTNTGSHPAYIRINAAATSPWALPCVEFITIPAGFEHSFQLVFNARDFDHDTVVAGLWTLSGNLLPVDVIVVMQVIPSSARDPVSPDQFSLSEPYPNPFNPETRIRLTLEQAEDVKLTVYAITGQTVASIFDGRREAGVNEWRIDGGHWATGTYFLHVTVGERQYLRKLLLLK